MVFLSVPRPVSIKFATSLRPIISDASYFVQRPRGDIGHWHSENRGHQEHLDHFSTFIVLILH
ncbi:hypothetical protein BDI4_830010 [Burkholderia diffusa]|nr:hypothetical protein BDI4_830010 [Burkholderia diffusa]